jgi:hypothetical protein
MEHKMALSNAERQRRYREKRKRELRALDIGPEVECPEAGLPVNIDHQKKYLRDFYGAIWHTEDACRMTLDIKIDRRLDPEHTKYAAYIMALAEQRLRKFKTMLQEASESKPKK